MSFGQGIICSQLGSHCSPLSALVLLVLALTLLKVFIGLSDERGAILSSFQLIEPKTSPIAEIPAKLYGLAL